MARANPIKARDGRGRRVRTVDTAERDAACARLRAQGLTLIEIAQRMDYADASGPQRAISRAMMATVQEAGEEAKRLELDRLDYLIAKAMEVLHTEHLAHSGGRLITLDDQPVVDHGPKLAAIREIRALSESRRKLQGTDAPIKHEVLTMDATEKAIADLEAELSGRDASRTAS